MTTRLLPRAEYHRLAGTLLESAVAVLPAESVVVAVEDDGQLVACGALYPVWHLDGVWIAPAYRQRVSVGRRLLRGLRGALQTLHVPEVWAMAVSSGSKLLCRHWRGRVTELACAHFTLGVPRG